MGGAALHKLRLQKSAWPPSGDTHNLLGAVRQPVTLQEHVAVLAYLIGGTCPEDLEAVCEMLAAEDREHAGRTAALEEKRVRLAAQEDRNGKLRAEVSGVESTGGTDTAEHLSLREQLTEMQAQGVAIKAAEERHSVVLEHCAAVATALVLDMQGGAGAAAPPPDRSMLNDTIDRAVSAAKLRLPQ